MARSYLRSLYCRRRLSRALILFAAFAVLTSFAWLSFSKPQQPRPVVRLGDYKRPRKHPIDDLISKAQDTFDSWLVKQSRDVHAAAAIYRLRRGRHPPPGFNAWFEFARGRSAIVVEDFFDQIYHDLRPFWGVPARQIRQRSQQIPDKIKVRNGKVVTTKSERDWTNNWIDMMEQIQHLLPDVDMPINLMDEPRVIVPWDNITGLIQLEQKALKLLPVDQVLKNLSMLDVNATKAKPTQLDFIREGLYWDTMRIGCGPKTPSWHVPAATDFSGPPPVHCSDLAPKSFATSIDCGSARSMSTEGYVSNWTLAKDPCLQPQLRESHGSFVEPVSQSTSRTLIPYFSGSKTPVNNDILVPAAMYWPDKSKYMSGKYHGNGWEDKATGVMWRGGATGGRNRNETWTRFQRHRFVSLMNNTEVRKAQQDIKTHQGPDFILPPYQEYLHAVPDYMNISNWIYHLTNVGFTHLTCFPETGNATCPYTDPYFAIKKGVSLKDQFHYKYLPDIDGNSFSGRFLTFLRSTSLPIKASIYSEWHDSRLIPWLHFVPMHNSFVDIYGILEYFIGYSLGVSTDGGQMAMQGGHDEQAKKIALAGKAWAEKVLRKDDMLIYMLRLLLEYRRVYDDEREKLGFVGDLDGSMHVGVG